MKTPESGEQPVVFVIDDDESLRDALKMLFGMVGLRAETFAAADDFLKGKPPAAPSCLVLDIRLPGISGLEFLPKPFRDQDMLDAVQLALERDRTRRQAERASAQLRSNFESLSPREREVMAFVTAGLMNKQIAGRLGLAEVTVKLHRGSLMRKMNARSVAELARMAQILGIPRPKS
jgi:FixJ family two-component response regulator